MGLTVEDSRRMGASAVRVDRERVWLVREMALPTRHTCSRLGLVMNCIVPLSLELGGREGTKDR